MKIFEGMKKLLSVFLCAVMVLSILPAGAVAVHAESEGFLITFQNDSDPETVVTANIALHGVMLAASGIALIALFLASKKRRQENA